MKQIDKEWALLPLRLIIGFGFAAHGYAKISRGVDNFATVLGVMGIPAPHFMAWLTSLVELVGGISLMAGAFVVAFTLPLGIIMMTAMFGVHFQYGFSSIRLKSIAASGAEFGPVGYEMNLIYIAGLLALALSKPTSLSLDRWLRTRTKPSEKPIRGLNQDSRE